MDDATVQDKQNDNSQSNRLSQAGRQRLRIKRFGETGDASKQRIRKLKNCNFMKTKSQLSKSPAALADFAEMRYGETRFGKQHTSSLQDTVASGQWALKFPTPVLPQLPKKIRRLMEVTYAVHGGAQRMTLDEWRDLEQRAQSAACGLRRLRPGCAPA